MSASCLPLLFLSFILSCCLPAACSCCLSPVHCPVGHSKNAARCVLPCLASKACLPAAEKAIIAVLSSAQVTPVRSESILMR